jgi:hypothetical protein
MTPQREESDQLPEEQPSGSGADDDTAGSSRKDANKNAGGADGDGDDKSGQATGNPQNAG